MIRFSNGEVHRNISLYTGTKSKLKTKQTWRQQRARGLAARTDAAQEADLAQPCGARFHSFSKLRHQN